MAIGGYLPIERVYSYEPMPKSLSPEEQKYIVGVQANLWTEYIPDFKQVQYMVLPRMAALCESQWCAPERRITKPSCSVLASGQYLCEERMELCYTHL